MGWASEQFRRDLGLTNHYDNSSSLNYPDYNSKSKENKTKKMDLNKDIEKIENENQPINRTEALQGIVNWKYFDDNIPQRREPLSDCLQALIDAGYHIDNVIPTVNYQKADPTTILITEAIIILSQ